MSNNTSYISEFKDKVGQLILKSKELRQENASLKGQLDECKNKITELKKELENQKNRSENIMMAKMLEISDNDIDKTRQKVITLIGKINRCITMVNEKENKN